LAGVGVFVAPDIVLTTAGLHPSESYGPNFGHDKDEIVFLTVKPYGSNRSYKTKVIVRKPGGHDLMLLKVEGYRSPKFFRLTTKVEGGERVTILAVRVTKSQFFGEEIFTPQKVSGYIPDAKLLDDFWDIRQSILFRPPLEINKDEGAPIINSEGKVIGVFVGQNLRFRNIVTGEKTPVFGVAERVDSVIPYLQKIRLQKIRQSQSRRGR